MLSNDPIVKAVHDVKAVAMGGSVWRFKAEVTLDGEQVAKRYMTHARSDVGVLADAVRKGILYLSY